MASKWDKEEARQICAWIERATGDSVPSDDPISFAEKLDNGQTLCKYCLHFCFCRYYFVKTFRRFAKASRRVPKFSRKLKHNLVPVLYLLKSEVSGKVRSFTWTFLFLHWFAEFILLYKFFENVSV